MRSSPNMQSTPAPHTRNGAVRRTGDSDLPLGRNVPACRTFPTTLGIAVDPGLNNESDRSRNDSPGRMSRKRESLKLGEAGELQTGSLVDKYTRSAGKTMSTQ